MENKKRKKRINWSLIVIVLLSIIIIYFAFDYYRDQFSGDFSTINADWGAFGDYMNPFIALINLVFLVYITYAVKEMDDHREKNSINAQKTINLSNIRLEKVKEITKELDSMFISQDANWTFDSILDLKRIEKIASIYNSFNQSNARYFGKLFERPEFKNNKEALEETFRNFPANGSTLLDVLTNHTAALYELNNTFNGIKSLSDNSTYKHYTKADIPMLQDKIPQLREEEKEAMSRYSLSAQSVSTLVRNFTDQKNNYLNGLNDFILEDLKPEN